MFLSIYLFLKLQYCSTVIALASIDKPKGSSVARNKARWVGQTIAFKPILLATGLSLQVPPSKHAISATVV